MKRPLVVLDRDEQGRELLREAGELAAGVDARLDVVALMTADEFAEKRKSLDAAGEVEHTTFDDSAVFDGLRQDAEETVEDVLDGVDVDYDVVAARVGDSESEADRILETAADTDADHLFVSGNKRSPTGKAVFGDRAQALILNFEGPVTTLLD